MSTAASNRVEAFAGDVGTVCRDTADIPVFRDLAGQVGQDRGGPDVAPGDLYRANLQCLRVVVGKIVPRTVF